MTLANRMATAQQKGPVIEEIDLLSESDSENEVIIVEDSSNKNQSQVCENTKDVPAQCSTSNATKEIKQVYCDEDYINCLISNESDSCDNEANTFWTNEPDSCYDPLRNSNVHNKSGDTDDEQLFIAEDTDNHTTNRINHFVAHQSLPNEEVHYYPTPNEGQILEEITNTISTDDESDVDDSQTIKVPNGFKGFKIRLKKYIFLYCGKCNLSISYTSKKKNEFCKCGNSWLYACSLCKYPFDYYFTAVTHLKNKCLFDKYWHCPECKYSASTNLEIEKHIESTHAKRKCMKCKPVRVFKNADSLLKHEQTYHQNLNKNLPPSEISEKPNKKPRKKKKEGNILYMPLKDGYVQVIQKLTKFKDIAELNNGIEKLNLQDFADLHCLKCCITLEKVEIGVMKCKNCNGSLVYKCRRCNEYSSSMCGFYDHLHNKCESKEHICVSCNKNYDFKKEVKHKSCIQWKQSQKCKYCNFKTKEKKLLLAHVKNIHSNKEENANSNIANANNQIKT